MPNYIRWKDQQVAGQFSAQQLLSGPYRHQAARIFMGVELESDPMAVNALWTGMPGPAITGQKFDRFDTKCPRHRQRPGRNRIRLAAGTWILTAGTKTSVPTPGLKRQLNREFRSHAFGVVGLKTRTCFRCARRPLVQYEDNHQIAAFTLLPSPTIFDNVSSQYKPTARAGR